MGKVYIEIFIAENILINYLILYLSDKFLCIKASHIRLFSGAAIGCAYAVITVSGLLPFSDNIPFKMTVAVVMCAAAFGGCNVTSFLKRLFCIFIFTVFLGGAAYGFINILGGKLTSKGIVMYSSEFVFLLLGLFTGFLFADLMIRLKKKIDIQKELIYEITLYNNGKGITVPAFFDTGNNLYDNNDKPVAVVEYETVKHILCEEDMLCAQSVPFSTINGISTLNILEIDSLEFSREKDIFIDKASIALYFGRLSPENRFNALFGPGILFVGN